ncbi:MAG: hypothetical protein AAF433_08435 [Bacteroidota bacterium]
METPKNKQLGLRAILILQTLGLLFYTYLAMQNDGGNFFAKAIAFSTSLEWQGQFTLDFGCYLLLSELWIMWRNRYSLTSIVLSIAAMILGIIVFAPYLLYLLSQESGDLKRLLVGDR